MPHYDPALAVAYAKRWAAGSNVYSPKFVQYDVNNMSTTVPYGGPGGDCTNFASQCLHAGGWPMDYPKTLQMRRSINVWYYDASYDTDAPQPCSHTWIIAPFLASYLMNSGRTDLSKNKVCLGLGEARKHMKAGDIVQFSPTNFLSDISHTAVVTNANPGNLNQTQVHQHGSKHTDTYDDKKCESLKNRYVWVWRMKHSYPT